MWYEKTNLSPVQRAIYENYEAGDVSDLTQMSDSDCVVDGPYLSFLLRGGLDTRQGALNCLNLRGARIRGLLTLEGADVSSVVNFVDCAFEEEIVLRHARVRRFSMSACQARGIDASGVTVEGDLEFFGGSLCWGGVKLEGASINGVLDLTNSTVHAGEERRCVELSRARIENSVLMSEAIFIGQVRLTSCKIGGLLSFRRSSVVASGRSAIEAERAEIGESLFFQRGFSARGNVAFDNARIGGGVDATGASFQFEKTQRCLNLARARIERNLSFIDSLLDGNVRLFGTEVRGSIRFKGARILGIDRELNLDYSRSGRLQLKFAMGPEKLTLRYSTHNVLEDEAQSWPQAVALKGFSYSNLEDGTTNIGERLELLERDVDGFSPQPYEQLATALRGEGDETSARTASLRKQRRRRRSQPRPLRAAGIFVDGLIGYGYRNWYAAVWLLGILTMATFTFYIYKPVPIPAAAGRPVRPFLYALDLLLPVVDLGEEKNWVAVAPVGWLPGTLTLVGWILTTAVVAGLARLLNRST